MSKKEIVYIAGKINGFDEFEEYFERYERYYMDKGYAVLNPAKLPHGMSYEDYMVICFSMIDVADKVIMLPTYEDSPGAIREEHYSIAKGKELEYADDLDDLVMERQDKGSMRVVAEEHKPYYATEGAAGLDIPAHLDEPLTLDVGESAVIPTKLIAEIPEGHFGLVAVRSGLGFKHHIDLINSIGVIDEDYRGNIGVKLVNNGNEPYTFHDGDRIAQMILIPYIQPNLKYVGSLNGTGRGSDGFGSTGR